MLAEGLSCGLHRIERLMRLQALKARPRRRRLPPDLGERQATAVAANVLERTFDASAPNRKWIADFTYVWTAEGCRGKDIAARSTLTSGCMRVASITDQLSFTSPPSAPNQPAYFQGKKHRASQLELANIY